jgi:5'-3' exonuclease
MVGAEAVLHQLENWKDQGAQLFAFIQGYNTQLQTSDLAQRWQRWVWVSNVTEYGAHLWELIRELEQPDLQVPPELFKAAQHWQRLSRWCTRAGALFDFITAHNRSLDPSRLQGAYQKWASLKEQAGRVASLVSEINNIQTQISIEESEMLDNVIVDGFNLAFRCRYAPGIADLKDSKGRPTGIIFGFLRSLSALKKRYQTAQIYVCWDGSSQRRKDTFAGYKANRPERVTESFDQIGFLRGVLPLLGVHQAWNPQEEADDVIATLVRGPLVSDRNVILTTDRDLLQLVTTTTVVLVPESGGRKEIFFDIDKVREEYGVTPDLMPHLRAMAGDTSDNIPGVARVPTKILSALVRSYGTVEGIFSSGLPGLTKAQYARLREAEVQVKMNVGLMTLRTVPVTQIAPDSNQTAAVERLQDVEVKPEVVTPLFGGQQGFLKET